MQRLREDGEIAVADHYARSGSVSATAPALRATTGVPWPSASISGAQKPSCADIERYTDAEAYQRLAPPRRPGR